MNIKAHNIRGVSMLFRAIMKDKGGYFYRMMRNNIAWLNGKIWRVQVLYLANEPFKPN